MSDKCEEDDYKNDPREACKYGIDCYQKNKAHHDKFKHPPSKASKNANTAKRNHTPKQNDNQGTSEKPKKNSLQSWLKSPPIKKQKTEGEEIKEQSVSGVKEINVEKSQDKITEERNDKPKISLTPMDADPKIKIKTLFLVDMPDDFYQFWTFCEAQYNSLLSKGNPSDTFKIIGLRLVGPYDVLANRFNSNIIYDPEALLRHYRYYYDPPEFQTVLKGEDNGLHFGYFRDDPKESPVFVARNSAEENCIIKPVAENIFGAVNVYLEEQKKKANPFLKLKIVKLQNAVTTWAKKENITLSTSTVAMKKREVKVSSRTFHKAGLVVPYDKKSEVGYRSLAETDATIKGILTKLVNSESDEERKVQFSKLQPVITFANIANDECDFGASLELGLDLFSFGSPLLHESAKQLLTTAYNLLGRNEFAQIIKAHLKDRKKGDNLSIC